MDMADSPAAALAAFEARCDPSDPQQAALLEQMRQHTRELQRANWATQPNQRRSWNAPPPADRAKPPSANESLRCASFSLSGRAARAAGWRVLTALR